MTSLDFSSCILAPVAGDESSSSSVVLSSDGKYRTSSFYLDSSGRSSISLPLRLKFESRELLLQFIACKSFTPPPSNYDDSTNTATENSSDAIIRTIGIEAKVTLTFGNGSARTATVEGVTILSTRVGDEFCDDDKSCIYLNTEIIVRVSRGQQPVESDEDDNVNNDKVRRKDSSEGPSGVKTNLEITAVLSERYKIGIDTISGRDSVSALEALKVFSLRGLAHARSGHLSNRNVTETRLNPPFTLHVELTHALSISVQSFSGPKIGHTFVSLTMTHSNTHHQPVTITSIALHPGHSRYKQQQSIEFATNSSSSSLIEFGSKSSKACDMTKSVKWGYAPKSDPRLPLTLERSEAFSSILMIDASKDTMSRICSCPLSITAVIGNKNQHRNCYVVAAVEATWATSPAAIEPADLLRVEMSFADELPCCVGSPLTILLDIYNLGAESRHLMLLVDNSNAVTMQSAAAVQSNALNHATNKRSVPMKTVVVSEQGGYKFGVWGLSTATSSPGSYRDSPDPKEQQDLLEVDIALLLGELKAQSSTKAKLRVIPLREGTLNIPNFKLVDNRTGKRYSCLHRLQAVVGPAPHQ